MMNISAAIEKLDNVAAMLIPVAESASALPPFKYDYVWRLLESLYEKMNADDIDTVNQQVIAMAYEFIKRSK